ncbi:MAG: gliding motility-associated C-terminal domain-containing protein [Bacteroidetes bacterium]|nr:gliding motility-associated C-terminal domain-containing protein [Bacteroidota bacterium]
MRLISYFNISILIILIISCDAYAQVQSQKTFGGNTYDRLSQTILTNDKGYLMGGYTDNYGAGGYDILITKLDSNSKVEWSYTFGGTSDDYIATRFPMEQTVDGGYIIVGLTNSFGAGNTDIYLIKISASGQLQWSKTYGGSNEDRGISVRQIDSSGYYILADTRTYSFGSRDAYVIRTDGAGNIMWTSTFGIGGSDTPYGFDITYDGGLILAGHRVAGANVRGYLARLNSTGTLLWQKLYGGSTFRSSPYSVFELPDSGFIALGRTNEFGAGDYDMYVIRTDSVGSLLWSKTYGTASEELGRTLNLTADSGFVFIGYTYGGSLGGRDAMMIKTDKLGNLSWSMTYGGVNNELVFHSEETSSGGFTLAGTTESFGSGSGDFFLIRTNSSGISGCNEASITITANSASPAVATLSPGTSSGGSAAVAATQVDSPTIGCWSLCPIEMILMADTAICNGDSFQITLSGGTNHVWDASPDLSCTNCQNPIAFPTSTTKFAVTALDTNGCYMSDTIEVSIGNTLLGLTINDTTICPGDSVLIGSNNSGTFAWTPSATLDSDVISNPNAFPGTITTYTVIATDSDGCISTDSIQVGITNILTALTINDTTICLGDSVLIGSNNSGTFTWTPSATLNSAVISNPNAFPFTTTTYTVIAIDSVGCAYSDSITVTIGIPMIILTISDTVICPGDSIQIGSNNSGVFSWSPSNTLTSSTVSNPFAFPNNTTTYTVNAMDSNGCSGIDSITISINFTPSVTSHTTICSGGQVSMNANGGTTYSWSPSSSLSCQNCQSTMASPSTATTYSVVITDSVGCVVTLTTMVNVLAAQTVVAGSNDTICPGDSVILNGAINGLCFVNGIWSGGTGTYTPNDSTLNARYTPSAAEISAGSATLTLSSTINSPGEGLLCYDHFQQDSMFHLGTAANTVTGFQNYSGADIVAMGFDTTSRTIFAFTAIGNAFKLYAIDMVTCSTLLINDYFGSGEAYFAADYDNKNGILYAIGVPVFNVSGAQILYSVNTKNGNLTTIGPLGLTANSQASLSYLQGDGINGLAYDPSTDVLYGISHNNDLYSISTSSGLATFVGIVGVTSIRGMGYDYNSNSLWGVVSTQNLVQIDKASGATISWTAGGNFSFVSAATYVPSDFMQVPLCEDTMRITIEKPSAIASNDTLICAGDMVQLNAAGGTLFTWSPGIGLSDTAIANPNASPDTSTLYTVIVSNGSCEDTAFVTITVNPLPVANAGANVTITIGSDTVLIATGGGNYSWSPSTGLSCTDCPNPTANPVVTTTYTVVVTDAFGCTKTDSVTVFVDDAQPCGLASLFIPNAFTPNGDSQNDVLKIFGEGFVVNKFIIYDRWGEQVFSAQGNDIDWDGRYRGEFLNAGVFAYYLELLCPNNEVIIRQGDITLIR